MTSISYSEIYSSFLGEITDNSFVNRDEVESYELMRELLRKTLATPDVSNVFKTIVRDDEDEILSYELKYSKDNAQMDNDFVWLLLGTWMSYQWTHDKVKSIENTAQFLGTKEQKFYSQANHLAELLNLKADTFKEGKQIIAQYGVIANVSKRAKK